MPDLRFNSIHEPREIEEGLGNLSACVLPDLPGGIATGATLEQLRANMRTAVVMHIAGMQEDGLAVTDPTRQPPSFSSSTDRVR